MAGVGFCEGVHCEDWMRWEAVGDVVVGWIGEGLGVEASRCVASDDVIGAVVTSLQTTFRCSFLASS